MYSKIGLRVVRARVPLKLNGFKKYGDQVQDGGVGGSQAPGDSNYIQSNCLQE